MHEVFRELIESLEPSFQMLMRMEPVSITALPREMPDAGIYLFSEDSKYLYVGRSNSIRQRLQNHCRPSSGHNSATFAFRLARQFTGMIQATYSTNGSRLHLERNPNFAEAFTAQKKRVRNMDVRFVSELDPLRQALLEMYVVVSLKTPHNDFDNH